MARIQVGDVNAVTLNERCNDDATEIAVRIGYHYRFITVIHYGVCSAALPVA
ncbi:hypothetical protein [Streptomyces sp. NPDC007905]|uniref:hypothetical protein n=1 Tax=Streptomyces sp. NPDC007905 TaxID=3364788 RepID=UPI0036E549E7